MGSGVVDELRLGVEGTARDCWSATKTNKRTRLYYVYMYVELLYFNSLYM